MRIGSVVLASLAAGIWINLSGLALVHFVLGQDYVRTMMAHVPQPIGLATVARHATTRLGFGTLLVLLYITARPQFERLSSAAVAAAMFVFAAAYVPLSLALNEFAILVGWRLWVALAWGAAEAIVASLVGALLYEWIAA